MFVHSAAWEFIRVDATKGFVLLLLFLLVESDRGTQEMQFTWFGFFTFGPFFVFWRGRSKERSFQF